MNGNSCLCLRQNTLRCSFCLSQQFYVNIFLTSLESKLRLILDLIQFISDFRLFHIYFGHFCIWKSDQWITNDGTHEERTKQNGGARKAETNTSASSSLPSGDPGLAWNSPLPKINGKPNTKTKFPAARTRDPDGNERKRRGDSLAKCRIKCSPGK